MQTLDQLEIISFWRWGGGRHDIKKRIVPSTLLEISRSQYVLTLSRTLFAVCKQLMLIPKTAKWH